jgi:hypothetical protein
VHRCSRGREVKGTDFLGFQFGKSENMTVGNL